MNIETYITQLQAYLENSEWCDAAEIRRQVCQQFADRHDWAGLQQFFRDTFLQASQNNQQRMTEIDQGLEQLPVCREVLRTGLHQSLEKAQGRPEIKAIYFEYYFDGGEASEGAFFLCTEYSPMQDSDWGAHFTAEDVLNGPHVQHLLSIDEDFVWPQLERTLGESLGYVSLLAQLGEIIDEMGGCSLPVGYAEHDDSLVIHIEPNKS